VIFDFQSSLGGELKRKLEGNLVITLLAFTPTITTLDGHVFCWNTKKKGLFFPPGEQPLCKIIGN